MSGVRNLSSAATAAPPARAGTAGQIASASGVGGVGSVGSRSQPPLAAPVDIVSAVAQLAGFELPTTAPVSLSDQLLAYVAPSPRGFEAMSPGRLMPLLDMAIDQLARGITAQDELDGLGAAALERELRDHRDVAERRTTLIGG